jgi:hypothetical protein
MIVVSTLETIAEAKRALSEFMQQSRQAKGTSPLRPPDAGATFMTEGDLGLDDVTEDERGRISKEAREQARRYVEAKSKNVQPVRTVNESNEAAIEGQLSAFDWLKRKGRLLQK